jgi:tRNA(Arg) A34 adenosine deaminase TadA
MEEAARLARRGVESGDGGPFGAVVVFRGRIVGAAWNRVLGRRDPTAHAEIEAIREACRELGRFHLDGCELYATCEPCPMCLAAIHWARLDAVHYSMTRDDAAALGFSDAALYDAMVVPRLPLRRLACPAAEEVFRLWRERPDRTPY